MYIIEKLIYIFNKFKKKNNNSSDINNEENYNDCEHLYLPIDSTKKILACKHCGHIIKNED